MNISVKVYTQITQFDIETQIRYEFNNCKHLNKFNVSNIVSWIKSRGKKINILHCFVFLQNHCKPVVEYLDREAMYFLLEKICLIVQECLEGQIIKRNIKRGIHVD